MLFLYAENRILGRFGHAVRRKRPTASVSLNPEVERLKIVTLAFFACAECSQNATPSIDQRCSLWLIGISKLSRICEPFNRQSNSRQRILVVEDERDLRQITAEGLSDTGYQVDVAEAGATAWTALQIYRYDLLFTDQFMPKVSGVELLKKIHAARMTVSVIMATGFLLT